MPKYKSIKKEITNQTFTKYERNRNLLTILFLDKHFSTRKARFEDVKDLSKKKTNLTKSSYTNLQEHFILNLDMTISKFFPRLSLSFLSQNPERS